MRRGKERWTQADDKRLGRALLAVYAEHGEAVVTSDMCALWRRVQYFYQDLVTKEKAIADIAAVPRSARSLHTRWARDIRPEMLLYASIVDRLLQAGWKAAQALREASSRFQAKRRKVNTEIMRQFALDRKRADVQQVESEHPRLKFESFHYRHCYDVLHMNPRFVESLLCHKNGGTEGNGDRKRRRPPIGDSDEEERYSTAHIQSLPIIMAARALLLLPFAGGAAWSGNATLTRMRQKDRASPGGETLEFIPGSMDDTIMETLETGDIIFFQRKLTALQPLAAFHTWITRRQLRPRFDHCGWVYVDRLGRKFIVEETLDKDSRLADVTVTAIMLQRSKEVQDAANCFIAKNLGRTSRISLRHTASALISPDEMRKASSYEAPVFPSAAFVIEAYEAMGLVNKDQLTSTEPALSAATVTPRDLAASRIKLHDGQENGSDAAKAFGRLIPIRLE
ncbi:hypothetical protein PHYBOEH_011087 [Phytophthora boehmeriae]|uniref:Uncharacterized protein n=1 Tax=Phytophthora boehmeriae TaxID=109152 RepID=A0A8T1WYD7_9STRA|nr:hypothetical protein PHYBOEH_011087 [Phytophthora boehmeriae]